MNLELTAEDYFQIIKKDKEMRENIFNSLFQGDTNKSILTLLTEESRRFYDIIKHPCVVIQRTVKTKWVGLDFYIQTERDGLHISIEEDTLKVDLSTFDPLHGDLRKCGSVHGSRLTEKEKDLIPKYITICENMMKEMPKYRLKFITNEQSFDRSLVARELNE